MRVLKEIYRNLKMINKKQDGDIQ